MNDHISIEGKYPIQFHQKEAAELGQHIRNRQNVMLIGMKRVGISNFLRFFLYHEEVISTYLTDQDNNLFISVDLNDLVERTIPPFWILTHKRIVDSVDNSNLPFTLKKRIQDLFLESIQLHDNFLVKENVRKSLVELVAHHILPTIFFLRFDRLQHFATSELFSNLQAIQDATHDKASYVFTSFHDLTRLSEVFNKVSVHTFCQNMYIRPSQLEDIKIIADTYKDKYKITLSSDAEAMLFALTDGYVQYTQLALIILKEQNRSIFNKDELLTLFVSDERMNLQSEELWESLNETEKKVLVKVLKKQKISFQERETARYLWDTGFVHINNGNNVIFSPLFCFFIEEKKHHQSQIKEKLELTKKESLLFQLLLNNVNLICERELIITTVWPEQEALGVSDWAVDRLIARLRGKLKQTNSLYKIQTVRTRGHKLVAK